MSKLGFRLSIHKDVPQDLVTACEKFLHQIISHPLEERYFCRRHSSRAFYRRGFLGMTIGLGEDGVMRMDYRKDAKLVFRRISRGRRIYAIMPIDQLERIDGQPIDLDNCVCADHRGGQRVRIKGGFQEDDFRTYYEIGQIRG